MGLIGVMQGRLSPMIDNKIQCFPWQHWEEEFSAAAALGLRAIEWTIDADRLRQNPLNTELGQKRIKQLISQTGVSVPSITGDCFMQAPFYKATDPHKSELLDDFKLLCQSAHRIGARFIVIPLVDHGALKNRAEEDTLVEDLLKLKSHFEKNQVRIIFESDYLPAEYHRFLARLPRDTFGVNYDSGNSSSLGFSADEEFSLYGDRVLNIHLKDRVLGGTTVPLGEGHCDFEQVFKNIHEVGYQGNFILQAARAKDGDDAGAVANYLKFLSRYLS